MNNHTYWHKQDPTKPLYPDVSWSKPEQKTLRGRLGIIGGQAGGFMAVSNAYSLALKTGAGQVKLCLPDCLKKQIPPILTDVVFGASTPSGGFASVSKDTLLALAEWSNGLLFIGESGKNSETAIVFEELILKHKGPITVTRDAFDLLLESADNLIQRPDTVLVLSLTQLQKLFRKLYYPIIITHSINIVQLVEALHKITITYPASISVLHNEQIFIADNGEVTTTPYTNAIDLIRGDIAVKMAVYWLWNPNKKLAALTTSLVDA